MKLQPILTQISDIGVTDDELEYNICIKKYSAIGEGGKLIRVKSKKISQKFEVIISKRCKHFNGPQLFSMTCYHFY